MWDQICVRDCSGILVLSLSAILLFSYSVFAADCADSLLNSPEITQALLSDQWDQVFTIFSETPDCSLNSSAVLLQAHVALAVGYNNVATALFVLIQDSTQLEAWHNWTREFSEQHTPAAVGNYLLGDAKARLADFDGAMNEFDLALENDPSYFMARNARGVLNAIIYQSADDPEGSRVYIAAATDDFEEVNKSHPNFTDALVNRAVACIEANLLPGAEKYFSQALQVDPEYALAYNGRAMLYLNEKNLEEAQNDIITADSLLPNFPYFLWNAKAFADSSDTASAIGRIAWIKGKGISIDSLRGATLSPTDWMDLSRDFGVSTLDFVGQFAGMPELGTKWNDFTRDAANLSVAVTNVDYGGVYLDVQILRGIHRVGTNYALAYPRPKE